MAAHDNVWKHLLERKGLAAAASVLEDYGISCEISCEYNKRCMSPWACVTVSYFPVSLSITFLERGQNIHTHTTHTHNTHTHTHTYRHRRLWDWIDYLSIFRVKNEVSVAKIASIILSIFRVKTIDYRFRFLE